MFKKKLVALSAIMIAGLMTFQANVSADAVEEKPYLSLGADLSASQKSKVLELLGVKENELDQYKVVKVTNKDEHKYLDDYLDSSVIGTHALSSVLIEKRDKGEGIDVTTKNITYCTAGMYENALTTAGVTDANVTVAGPFNITGTAALVGAMNAYEDMTGENISSESKDAATNELVATANLAEAVGDSDKAEQLIAAAKEKVLSQRLTKREDIKKAIESSAKELGIEVPEDEVDKLVTMMQKVSKVDVNVDALKKQAGEIYNKLKDAGIDLSNVDTKGLAQKIGDFFANIFEAIVRFFSGLFG